MSSSIKNFIKLSNNLTIPQLGFGTLQITDPVILKTTIDTAIKADYRAIDTAKRL